jgi:hypothetical protein
MYLPLFVNPRQNTVKRIPGRAGCLAFVVKAKTLGTIAPPGQEGWREAPGWLFNHKMEFSESRKLF